MTNVHQINQHDSAVKRELDPLEFVARQLDDVFDALCADADNISLYHQLQATERAYRDALLPPWSVRWKAIYCVPRRQPFKDLDRRSNMNALRQSVTTAKRALARVRKKGSTSQQVAAEVALIAAEDALQIYRQHPAILTPAELQRATGAT
jgi:hypothetical protein